MVGISEHCESPALRNKAGERSASKRSVKSNSRTATQEALLLQYLPLVRNVVDRMRAALPAHLESDDLHSVGIAGLSRAVSNFDPEQESRFPAYAAMRIRGAVLDELRRMDWMSRGLRHKAKQITDVVDHLEQRLGRTATSAEVAGELSMSAEEYADLLGKVRPIVHVELDAVSPEDEDEPSLHESIPDERQVNACDRLQRKELIQLLTARIQRLPEMQQKVLAMYYFEELRLAEIALVFGVTESRICQLHTQAVATLRTSLKSALAQ